MKVSIKNKPRRSHLKNEKHEYLLSQKISDLELQIPGTRLEALINQLYHELEKAGILFKPRTYLSDEWGCPQNVPVIGIPFYLADLELCKLEGKLTGIEAETDTEVLMSLRHETGHAFNYLYRLYEKTEWQKVFGKYSQPYREDYGTSPFSARFVRHMPGWYAQKHPDEDFAETFAVWLTPGSDWKRVYKATPALKKLLYVDRTVRRYGRKHIQAASMKLDKPLLELNVTLDNWYKSNKKISHSRPELSPVIDEDLRHLFPSKRGQNAANILRDNRSHLIGNVNFWTGLDRHILNSLFDEILQKVSSLGLKIESRQTTIRLTSASAFLATLATNYQVTGQFTQE